MATPTATLTDRVRQNAVRPGIWGPSAWKFIHAMTLAYPDEPSEKQQDAAADLLRILAALLPCSVCRSHLTGHLRERPPEVADRMSFVYYVHWLHNKVNESTGKPALPMDEFLKEAAGWDAELKGGRGGGGGDDGDDDDLMMWKCLTGVSVALLVVLLILFLLFYFCNKCRRQ